MRMHLYILKNQKEVIYLLVAVVNPPLIKSSYSSKHIIIIDRTTSRSPPSSALRPNFQNWDPPLPTLLD